MSTSTPSYEDLLGRADVNDLDAILSLTNTDREAVIHAVQDNADALFTWNYEKGERPALNKLYEKAKTSQWNGETDLDWSIDVDQAELAGLVRAQFGLEQMDLAGSPFEKWSEKEWEEFGIQSQNWTL